MDPFTAITVLKGASAVAGGLSANAQAKNQAAQQELNAKLAETQILQRDTAAREDLLASESATNAARAANNLSATSTNAINIRNERRDKADRDRLIERADGA